MHASPVSRGEQEGVCKKVIGADVLESEWCKAHWVRVSQILGWGRDLPLKGLFSCSEEASTFCENVVSSHPIVLFHCTNINTSFL